MPMQSFFLCPPLLELPQRAFHVGVGFITTDCLICLGEFMEGESVAKVPTCSHAFHARFIQTWLTHSNHDTPYPLLQQIFFLPTVEIKSMTIGYCNKNSILIEFCCNKIFLLLLKILYCNKKYCCYNLL